MTVIESHARLIFAALAAGLLGGTQAAAVSQQDLQRLLADGSCAGCDLSGAEMARSRLSGSDLQGADLQGADLRQAVWAGVNLSNAALQNADLSGAVMRNIWFRGASLDYAVLDGTVFVGADFTAATGLTQAQLAGACDDQSGGDVSQVPISLSLAACE